MADLLLVLEELEELENEEANRGRDLRVFRDRRNMFEESDEYLRCVFILSLIILLVLLFSI